MTPEFIAIVALALYLLAGIFVLFLGGRLVQRELANDASKNDAAWPRPRAIEDLRPIQHLTVNFFARAEPCDRLLTVLARHREPLTVTALLEKARPSAGPSTNGDAPAFGIEWAALWIMRVAGLVSLNKRHVLLTDAGREVHRRIHSPSNHSRDGETLNRNSVYDALFVPLPVGNGTPSRRHGARSNVPDFAQRNRIPASFRIGELRKPSRTTATNGSTESINLETMKTPNMKKRTIIMTASDHEELSYAIAAAGKLSHRARGEMTGLKAELARAKIVGADEIRADVITMNSRAELLDLETGERMEFTLVFPMDANIEAGKISVLAPLGTAMLGYRVGDEFEWIVPYGLRRLKVVAVRFQPEAALAMAA
jgi:regulator of nucleoside diphosphate kinase